MYNVNKGQNSFEESEILEPLHACLRELLERDRLGKPKVEYSDDDVIAATLLFSHILGSRLILKLTEEKVSIGYAQHLASTYGESIQLLAKQMTNVDMSVTYGDSENK